MTKAEALTLCMLGSSRGERAHDTIAREALARLRAEVDRLALTLLPRRFTLADAHLAFERVLDVRLDKSSFRKRLLGRDAVRATSAFRTGKHRPAQLYAAARGARST